MTAPVFDGVGFTLIVFGLVALAVALSLVPWRKLFERAEPPAEAKPYPDIIIGIQRRDEYGVALAERAQAAAFVGTLMMFDGQTWTVDSIRVDASGDILIGLNASTTRPSDPRA